MLENMLLLNWWVATGVLVLEIGFLGKLLSLIILSLPETKNKENSFKISFKELINDISKSILEKFNVNVMGEKFLLVCIFVFSLGASVMTLVYSEIFLQIPCALCWWQRVFMYGIVVISATALWAGRNGDRQPELKGILKYILNFSILGFGFALYQHVMQIMSLYGTHLPCPVSGEDCSKMTIFEYGHITFPFMAVVLFAFFIVIILLQRKINTINN